MDLGNHSQVHATEHQSQAAKVHGSYIPSQSLSDCEATLACFSLSSIAAASLLPVHRA
jgi:hypothetical protein